LQAHGLFHSKRYLGHHIMKEKLNFLNAKDNTGYLVKPSAPYLDDEHMYCIPPSAPYLESDEPQEASNFLGKVEVKQEKAEKEPVGFDRIVKLMNSKEINDYIKLFYAAVTKDDALIKSLIDSGASLTKAIIVGFIYWKRANGKVDLTATKKLLELGEERNIGFDLMANALAKGNSSFANFLIQADLDIKEFEEVSRISPLTVFARLGLGNYFRIYLYDDYLYDYDTKTYRFSCNDNYLWKLRAIAAYHEHTYIVNMLDQVLPNTFMKPLYASYAYNIYRMSFSSNLNLTNSALDYPRYQHLKALNAYQRKGFQELEKRYRDEQQSQALTDSNMNERRRSMNY